MRLRQSPQQHVADGVFVQHLLAVGREHFQVPLRLVHPDADEPAEQHAVPDLIDELSIATDREQELQHQGPHHLLRPDRAADRGNHAKPIVKRAQRRIDRRANAA